MIDEVSDVFGWDRKHTIKALNGQVCLAKTQPNGAASRFTPMSKRPSL
jgi:hypothetical protein